MIRRSKVTAAASSSCSSAVKNNGNDKNITLEFASECHATDGNHNNSSSDKRKMQGYAGLRSFFSPLSRQTTTKSTKKKTSKTECKRLTKSTTTTLRCCLFLLALLLIAYQLDAHVREYQGPLDHVSSSILKPYYEMSCPSFSRYLDDNTDSSTYNSRDNDHGAVRSWDCNTILGKQTTNDSHDGIIRGATTQSTTTTTTTEYHPSFPRIFMIGARDETEDTFQSWQSQLGLNDNTAMSPQHRVDGYSVSSSQPYLKRINTLQVSNQFATSGGAFKESSPSLLRLTTTNNTTTHQTTTSNQRKQFLCRKIKWEQRLFHVYQHVFSELLATYPNDDGFVIIEDDATLLNPMALAVEVCHAHDQQIQFYSLYRSPLQQQPYRWWRVMYPKQSSPPSCVYRHGTVAFYIQRQLMQQIVNERRRSFFCRFPIDMYISKFGPWYATRNEVVGHLGRGRVGSS